MWGPNIYSACYETRPRTIPPDHANWKLDSAGTAYDVDCGTEAGCKCLGDPSIYWRRPTGPGLGWRKTLELENTIMPCIFLDGLQKWLWDDPILAPKLQVTTPVIPPKVVGDTHTWWKSCYPFVPWGGSYADPPNRGCLPRFPRNGWHDEIYVIDGSPTTISFPTGPPCDGVSWTTLDWQNGTIVFIGRNRGFIAG